MGLLDVLGGFIDGAMNPEKYVQCCANCVHCRGGVCEISGTYVAKTGCCGYWETWG